MKDTDDGVWREKLTSEEYYVCREKGTERAFSGEYWDCKVAGSYLCKCCEKTLFLSEHKYDSGCGWPSFYQGIDSDVLEETSDTSLGMVRTEITCKNCVSHLGHVFEDGPEPTGLRYCINSLSISSGAARISSKPAPSAP